MTYSKSGIFIIDVAYFSDEVWERHMPNVIEATIQCRVQRGEREEGWYVGEDEIRVHIYHVQVLYLYTGPQYKYMMGYKASLNGSFIKDFMTLNIITYADMAKRENDRVS